jgi:hypothetical protein
MARRSVELSADLRDIRPLTGILMGSNTKLENRLIASWLESMKFNLLISVILRG